MQAPESVEQSGEVGHAVMRDVDVNTESEVPGRTQTHPWTPASTGVEVEVGVLRAALHAQARATVAVSCWR